MDVNKSLHLSLTIRKLKKGTAKRKEANDLNSRSMVLRLLHLGVLELAGRHTSLEENVQLSERPTLHLRQAEVGPHERAKACPRPAIVSIRSFGESRADLPEPSADALDVPPDGVHEVGVERAADDTRDVVQIPRQTGRLGS